MSGNANEQLLQRFRKSNEDTLLIDTATERLWTYGEVWAAATKLVKDWRSKGATHGEAIALMLPNGPGFICSYLACFIGGFVAAPVNPELADSDIEMILSLLHPALVIRETSLEDSGYEATVPVENMNTDPDAVCSVFFTSGTTGLPKGVQHSLNALVGNVSAFNEMTGLGQHTRMYHVLPMAYMAGFLNTVLSPVVAGGTVIIGPRFSPRTSLDFWTAASRTGADSLWLTPSIAAALSKMARESEQARANAAGFTQVFCGTAPLHETVRRDFAETFAVDLQESYGTSELLLIAVQTREEAPVSTDVGRPLPGLKLQTRTDADGNPELMLQSPWASLGYMTVDRDVGIDATPEGFFRTGDVGELRGGYLKIIGRIKDLIIRGGVNVAPLAVENVLRELPGASDVAVVGLPHPFWGEIIVACLEAGPDAEPDSLAKEAQEQARRRLTRSHQPDQIEVFNSFPRAVTGKVQKSLLRERLG